MDIYMTNTYLMLRSIPLGNCDIFDGILMILTLGNLRYSFSMEFIAWDTKRWLRGRRLKWSHKEK
jgi:hypothetical protein